VALSVDGAQLIVKGVQASAKGTVWLLESASDGAAASIELSAAGEVIAFIPNAIGKALLYNERL
jgi:hypothetical protein